MTGVIRSGPRYLAGAVLCAAINNVILIVGSRLGFSDLAGIVATWLLGGTAGYFWHQRISFRAGYSPRAYAQFLAGVALGIPVTWLVLTLFHRWLNWHMIYAAPATTIVLFGYNYLNARLAILRRRLVRKP